MNTHLIPTALTIYLSIGISVLLISTLRRHILTGFQTMVLDYLRQPGFKQKSIAVPGLFFFFAGVLMALLLYPVMFFTRSLSRKHRKATLKTPSYYKVLPGYPHLYQN